ncbi:hypothetical protein [Chamaesiphon sp. VAR_48_metabat_135_sub]|uniref:hypothetical protein n=1 Tax=Chamaesiphon sp. VAR_48_metabat_135_sub TaxID=2964699 RepID=UPI00286C1F5C|nr:hypothetical protein [Chamaesiphon sp. VAR_48_metabat_135_sub]
MDNIFPWYDSIWLSDYVRAKRLIETNYPNKYLEFVDAFEPLKTRSNFETMTIDNIFDDETFARIEDSIAQLSKSELERQELLRFGRLVVHDNAYFTELHHQITPLVSDLVGELVEPSYNFLSLYNNLGICRVHMDAPYAKYTLDLCVDRSHSWPIYFSQVRDWPEDFDNRSDWEQAIETDPENIFTAHDLIPRQAAIFSGSSQWHYRHRIPQQIDNNFCHLLFFHFLPKGMANTIDPRNWAKLFDLPELSQLYPRLLQEVGDMSSGYMSEKQM